MNKTEMNHAIKLYKIRRKETWRRFLKGLIIPAIISTIFIFVFLDNQMSGSANYSAITFIDWWIIWSLIILVRSIIAYKKDNYLISMYPANNISHFVSFSLLQYQYAALTHVIGILFYLALYAGAWAIQAGNDSMVLTAPLIPAQFLADVVSGLLYQFLFISLALFILALMIRFGNIMSLAAIFLLAGLFDSLLFGSTLPSFLVPVFSFWTKELSLILFITKMVITWGLLTWLAILISRKSIRQRTKTIIGIEGALTLLIVAVIIWIMTNHITLEEYFSYEKIKKQIAETEDMFLELNIDPEVSQITVNSNELETDNIPDLTCSYIEDKFSPDGKIYVYYKFPKLIDDGMDFLAYQQQYLTADYSDGELVLKYELVLPQKQVIRLSGYTMMAHYRGNEYPLLNGIYHYSTGIEGEVRIMVPEGVSLITKNTINYTGAGD